MKENKYNIFQKSLWGLMGISDSVYVFLSGILISLFTNLLTSLCFEDWELGKNWCIIVTIGMSALSGGLCMLIAAKLSPLQNILKRDLETFKEQDKVNGDLTQRSRRRKIFADLTKKSLWRWMLVYFLFITSFIASIVLMILKFVLFK